MSDWLLIAAFLIGIAIPGGMLLLRDAAPSATFEQRAIAPWPQSPLNQQQLATYPARFEAAFTDRYFGRQSMIRWYNLARLRWLGLPPPLDTREETLVASAARGGGSVVAGKNGWLFFTGDRVIDDYRGTRLFAEDELQQWIRVLQARQTWLADHGIEYVVVIAPNKHTIHGEFLPDSVRKIGDQTRLDQLTARMRSETTVQFVDLQRVMEQAKPAHRVYHRTDTHWNDVGAFYGAEHVASQIASRGSQANRQSAFWASTDKAGIGPLKTRTYQTAGGDLANMLGLADLLTEERVDVIPSRPRQAKSTALDWQLADEHSGIDVRSYVVDQLAMAADVSPIRVLVLHDSFGLAMMPHLSERFLRVDYLHTYDFDAAMQAIESLPLESRPRVVVQQFVERILQTHEPASIR